PAPSYYIDNLIAVPLKASSLHHQCVLRRSALVLPKLSRGAPPRPMRSFAEDSAKTLRVIAPNEREWIQSGRIVNRLVTAKGYDVHKTRELHFDALIALTARRIGAYLITCNVGDFTAVHEFLDFNLVCW